MRWSVALGLRTMLAADPESLRTGLDALWVLMVVEAALTQAKDSVNLRAKNTVDYRSRPAPGRLGSAPRP
ncbi:MAG: hypothetical protein Q8Q12_06465 [bacterium]|nr:hypothetical protein [bacterium]